MTSDGSGQGSFAAAASQRMQSILEAAEASAADIRREAELDAEAIRARAREDAGRASQSIEAAVRRLEELHGELGTLIASLRDGEGESAATESAATGPAAGGRAATASAATAAAADTGQAPTGAGSSPVPGAEDAAGVRLIALNMALDGTPREETAQFLAENFALADPERLLDEVYASAGA